MSPGRSLPPAISPQAPAQFPPPIVPAGATVKLSRHAYLIPDPEITLVPNVGIVVGSEATLVIDTGMGPRNARTILAEVAKVSRNTKLIVMATHTHAEHISGLAAFPPGTTFVAARAQVADIAGTMERGFGGMARLSPFIGELLQDATLRQPDMVFDAELVLDLGGVRVRLIWMGPAHSTGDTVAVVEGEGVVFAGDLVPRGRFLSFTPQSSRTAFLTAFSKLEALRPKTIVPSHGPTSDLSVIREQRGVLEAMAARVRTLKTEGRTLEETIRTVAAEFQARYPAWRATVPNEIAPTVRTLFAE